MDYPRFVVSNQKEESISIQRAIISCLILLWRLTPCIPKGFSHTYWYNKYRTAIVYFKGSQVKISKLWCISVPEDFFIWVLTVCQSTHLGVFRKQGVNADCRSFSLRALILFKKNSIIHPKKKIIIWSLVSVLMVQKYDNLFLWQNDNLQGF